MALKIEYQQKQIDYLFEQIKCLKRFSPCGEDAFIQIQSDWNQNDETQVDYLKNKPTIINPTGLEFVDTTGFGIGGWQLIGRNQQNYGTVGAEAKDLSYSTQPTGINGATGEGSFSTGLNNRSTGSYSFTANSTNRATGFGASAFGLNNESSGFFSFTSGNNNIASGDRAFSTGGSNVSSGIFSATFGRFNTASDDDGFAVNFANQVTGQWAFGSGNNNTASGQSSSVFGANNESSQWYSTSFGERNISSGTSAMAMGWNVFARSRGELSIGTWGTDYVALQSNRFQAFAPTDRVFNVGNGTALNNESDAFTILKSGLITAPSLEIVEIDNGPNKTLITKEWFEANNSGGGTGGVTTISRSGSNATNNSNNEVTISLGGSGTGSIVIADPTGLERIDQGNGNGWRLVGSSGSRWGNIGAGAVDLSRQDTGAVTTSRGAIGVQSFAANTKTIASGGSSTAFGTDTEASGGSSFTANFQTVSSGLFSTAFNWATQAIGPYSFSMNGKTIAEGYYSTSMGRETVARNEAEVAIGFKNTEPINPNPNIESGGTVATPRHRLFVIGDSNTNGLAARTDIFSVFGNQGIVIHPKTISTTSHPDLQAGMIRTSGINSTFIAEIYDGTNWRTLI